MKIKVAGYIVRVEKDSTILANDGRIGEYSSFEQKIRIMDGLTQQEENETLIHEILECINDIYELGLNHDEQLCKLSIAIHQILVDNPAFLLEWRIKIHSAKHVKNRRMDFN